MRSFHYAQTGQAWTRPSTAALAARAIQERTQLTDEWTAAVPLILLRVYPCLDDYQAVEREAAAALAHARSSPNRPGWCWCPARGRWPGSSPATWPRPPRPPGTAEPQARRLGFDQHFFAVDYLRAQAGLALERRDLDTAERLTEQALSIRSGGGRSSSS